MLFVLCGRPGTAEWTLGLLFGITLPVWGFVDDDGARLAHGKRAGGRTGGRDVAGSLAGLPIGSN
jgi:hypothetical protein